MTCLKSPGCTEVTRELRLAWRRGLARLIYRTHLDRGAGRQTRIRFTETDYARRLGGAHPELGGAIVPVEANLITYVSREMLQLIAARSWLTLFQLPA
jgi:hypothetical protein